MSIMQLRNRAIAGLQRRIRKEAIAKRVLVRLRENGLHLKDFYEMYLVGDVASFKEFTKMVYTKNDNLPPEVEAKMLYYAWGCEPKPGRGKYIQLRRAKGDL